MRRRGVETVTGDADEAAQALRLRPQDRFGGVAAAVQFGQVGNGVELIEIERVAPEQTERLFELGPYAVGVRPKGLATHEEPVPDGRDQGPDQFLGLSVLGRDVQVVHPGVEGLDRMRSRWPRASIPRTPLRPKSPPRTGAPCGRGVSSPWSAP